MPSVEPKWSPKTSSNFIFRYNCKVESNNPCTWSPKASPVNRFKYFKPNSTHETHILYSRAKPLTKRNTSSYSSQGAERPRPLRRGAERGCEAKSPRERDPRPSTWTAEPCRPPRACWVASSPRPPTLLVSAHITWHNRHCDCIAYGRRQKSL